jgi:hypothetical protein
MFLDRYRVNLLALPGRRVRVGSVYIQEDGRLTAPGMLADLVEPKLDLPAAYPEDPLPELSGAWSGRVSVHAGIGLLESFMTAIGASGLIDELNASIEHSHAQTVAYRFQRVRRESISSTALGTALIGHRLVEEHPWVAEGNRYYAVAAVMYSWSMSVQGHDEHATTLNLGAGIATVGNLDGGVSVERASDAELVYHGADPLAIAVELYELRRDNEGKLEFRTPKGPLKLAGLAAGEEPDPVFIGEDEDALIEPEEREAA